MQSFVTGFFHLAKCFQGSPILEHELVLHSFLLLNNTPWCGFYLSVDQWTNTWVVSTFSAGTNNAAVSVNKLLCGYVLIYVGSVCMGGTAGPLEERPDCSPKWLQHFAFPPAGYAGTSFSTSWSTLVIFCPFDSGHLIGVRRYFIVT